ncbi:MAG TPA: TolC family outer membrane protein [Usitatibacter sp.]|nr:TolC family outer membrane protein [Usitatibacter sp.]
MRPLRTALALAFAALFVPAHAADDLVAIYHDALTSDPVYQSARAQYEAGIEKLPQARSGYLPLLSGSASAFRNHVDNDVAPNVTYNTNNYVVTLTQPIFRMQNWIGIDEAQQQVLQAEAALTGAQQDLVLRVAQAYFDVLLAQDNVALSESQKVAISEQLAQAKRNFEVGTATIVDTLEAQARYDQATATEISDKNNLEVKRRALQQLLGKEPGPLAPLKEPLVLSPPSPADIEAWVKVAEQGNYAVISAKAGAQIARQEIERQKAAYWPTLDASASYGQTYNPATSNIGIVGPNSVTGSVGITLSMPFYTGGLIQSRVREAVANRDRADQDLENAVRTVAQAARADYLNVTSGIAQVKALEQALKSTQSQLDSTILGRDVGVRTSVDVLNAQQQVYQTRRDLQQARYNYLLNTLRLKSATGQLADTDVDAVSRELAR